MFGVQNQFLQNFMKMRAELGKKPVDHEAPRPGRGMPEVPKKGAVVTLRSIIEDKPKQKAVVQYFRNRVEELQAEED
jgi:hypothetical protein